MVVSIPQRRSTRPRGQRLTFRLDLEALETRTLPSVTTWPGLLHPVAETEPNDTLDQAQNLGDLTTTPRAEVIGTISNGPAGGAVDWYSFQLDRPANVRLLTPKATSQSPPVTTLSLYNTDLFDANDPYDQLNHRLLDQSDSAANGGVAEIDRRLAPGTYYVAVSGSGNHYFHPFLADSGYAGATGDYGLLITAADLGLGANNGPTVLAADPQPGAALNRSPFLIRVNVSEPLDPSTVSASGSVQLLSNTMGTFGDGNDQVVSLATATLSTDGTELLIAPAAPLAPGYYEVLLAGNSNANSSVLKDLNGLSLGTSPSQLSGADFSYTFHIKGNEGSTTAPVSADDTLATSHQLGDLTQAGFVQIAGAIGDDATDPVPFDGSDVDLYHFQVSGPGRYAFTTEVFAGRIGSPLSPGVSLFQFDSSTQQVTLVGSNAGTLNATPATNGTFPLFSDATLYASLQAGDYYLAVSNNLNVPNTTDTPPGTNGVFDPTISHSGQNGGSTGDYVLNLQVQAYQNPPQALSTTPIEGATFNAAPIRLTVQFSNVVNLQPLAFQTNVQRTPGTLAAVYVQGSDGTKYYPRLESFDLTTDQATFLMLNGLNNGSYTFHLSGPLGVADLAGNALVGNDPSGDYVVHFNVNGPVRGTNGNPLLWYDQEPNDDLAHPQNLGVLFPHELQAGVHVVRNFTQNPSLAPADTADNYQFQVLQSQLYFFNFLGSGLPHGVQATLYTADGTPVHVARQPTGGGFQAQLDPGTYEVQIGNWTSCMAASVQYALVIQLGGDPDNPVPLTAGPAPAISIQLVTDTPPSPPPTALVVTPPPTPPTLASTPPAPPASTPPSQPSDPPANNSTTPPGAASPGSPATGPTSAPATTVVTTTPPPPGANTPGSQTVLVPPAQLTPSSTITVTVPPIPATTPAPSDPPVATVSTTLVTNAPAPAPSSSTGPVQLPAATAPAPATAALPTSSSGSVAVSVNLVTPVGANRPGITLALLHTPADRPIESLSLPSSLLMALGAAPVGGIKDTTVVDAPTVLDHPQVRLPDLSSPRPSPLGTVVITRTDPGTSTADSSSSLTKSESTASSGARVASVTQGTAPSSAGSQTGKLSNLLSKGLRHLVNDSYASVLDAFFGMAQWLEETALQAPQAPSVSEDSSTQDESADLQSRGTTFLQGTPQGSNGADRLLVNGMAVLATVAVARPQKKPTAEIQRPKLTKRSPSAEGKQTTNC